MSKNYEYRETVYRVSMYYVVGWDPCGRSEKDCGVETFKKKADAEAFFETVCKTRLWDDKSKSSFVDGTFLPYTRRFVSNICFESETNTRIKTVL